MNSKKYEWENWNDIDWQVVEVAVFKLQKRIYKYSLLGDKQKVHKLQRLFVQSYFVKLLAIRRVTQDNQGKKTAGTDGIKSLTPKQRMNLAKTLKPYGNTKPVKRIWIPKKNGKKRPLGIPTIEDRIRQGIFKMALEPEWEAKFEENSYGFRPSRSTHDAREAIFNAIKFEPKYVLEADINGCFDNIDHQKLLNKLETLPTFRNQIKKFLKSGVMDNGFQPTQRGTPQGGLLSPLLANIALHGLEAEIKAYVGDNYVYRNGKGQAQGRKRSMQSVYYVRYADDFVILHSDLEIMKGCQKIVNNWLKSIGLELNKDKTKISHTLNKYEGNNGFDFLGFEIKQYKVSSHHSGRNTKGKILGHKTIIKPSKESINNHIKQIGDTIKGHKSSSQMALIQKLNPIIKGWSNYYRGCCSSKIFSNCDNVVFNQLWSWAKRRHPKKGKGWVLGRYWHNYGTVKHCFSTKFNEKQYILSKHSKTEIVKHVKVIGTKSVYDGDLTYWGTRLSNHPELSVRKRTLLKNQKGFCNLCKLKFKTGDVLEVDHIIPRNLGGKDIYENLQLLHRHCHDTKTAKDGSLKQISQKRFLQRGAVCGENRKHGSEERF
jgi:RNA-directed DNA polymerase